MLAKLDLTTVSEIARDIAQVFFASVFINSVLTGKIIWANAIAGLLLSTVFWLFGIILTSKYITKSNV
ncbi:MAG: hypothetical protein AAB861_01135 [Patescibacteria group bacterium]|mgnify:CR=1 FL=1